VGIWVYSYTIMRGSILGSMGGGLGVPWSHGTMVQPEDGPHVGPKHVVVRTLIITVIEVK